MLQAMAGGSFHLAWHLLLIMRVFAVQQARSIPASLLKLGVCLSNICHSRAMANANYPQNFAIGMQLFQGIGLQSHVCLHRCEQLKGIYELGIILELQSDQLQPACSLAARQAYFNTCSAQVS